MDVMELERLKFAARVITCSFVVLLDVIWVFCSRDDSWESVPSILCAFFNIGLLAIGVLVLAVWAWT